MSDKLARVLTGLAVLAVAIIAAVVSYSHIQALALSHGYTPGTARLLPFSVDGLIVASSLALANGARPALARTGLVLGVLATVAANVMFGARFGLVGEVISAWPAVAFLVSSEILIGMVRARGIPTRTEAAGTVAEDVHQGMPSPVPGNVPVVEQVNAPADVPVAEVPPAPVTLSRTVAAKRVPKRASGSRTRAPERIFAADLSRGELPSLRAIKTRAKCGTDRARVIRDELARVLEEAPEAA